MASSNRNTLKIIGLVVLVALVLGGIQAYRMYNKPHRNVETATAIEVAATKLAADYEANEAQANMQFLDKVLQVSGTVNAVSKNQEGYSVVTLTGTDMAGVMCTLEDKNAVAPAIGSSINIRGICTGYLTDVVVARAHIQQNSN